MGAGAPSYKATLAADDGVHHSFRQYGTPG